MSTQNTRYIPALSFRWLTWIYDPLLKWGMKEAIFKRALIEQANIKAGMKVLDLGCGTGTLTVMLKQMRPNAIITGLDGDNQVLEIARSKAEQAGVDLLLDHGMAYSLPYLDGTFDKVVSSLVIHHLTSADKRRTFQEVLRVLSPGGSFHIVDFGPPYNHLTNIQAIFMQNLEEAADNFKGNILAMLQETGFEAEIIKVMNTIFGPIAFYLAVKPNRNLSRARTET
jgi:ubiquinone/menaquinone biosynthesis C-methylase UbiE